MIKLHRDETGLTLIELVIAIVIVAAIGGVVTMSIFQVFNINTRSSNHMLAVRQVQQAGKDVSEDGLQARDVYIGGESDDYLVRFEWFEWDGPTHNITYTITNNSELRRTHSVYDNGELDSETTRIVASYIIDEETSFEEDGSAFAFRVTARVGGQSETRVYDVTRRIW